MVNDPLTTRTHSARVRLPQIRGARTPRRSVLGRGLTACELAHISASFRMPVHCTIEPADCSAAELLLLAIGRAGVLTRSREGHQQGALRHETQMRLSASAVVFRVQLTYRDAVFAARP